MDPSCSTTWTLSLETSPLEDSFFVNALLSPLLGLKGPKISSLLPFGIFLVEPSLAVVTNSVSFLAS